MWEIYLYLRHFPIKMEKIKFCTNSLKDDKQCVKNFRPVSFLPICSRVFEHIIIWCSYNLQKKNSYPKINQYFYPNQLYQCILARQRTTRYPFVHYSALFLYTLSVFHCSNLYFFILHSFHVALFNSAPFPCSTFLCSNPFMLHFFSCCTFFMALFHVAVLHVAMFLFCILLLLYSSHVAISSCCTLFMLRYYQRCSQDPHKHLKWGALKQ